MSISIPPSRRVRIEAALTMISVVAVILTLVARDWIERTLGVSPDGGSGEAEWLFTGVAVLATAVFATLTTVDWRRAKVAPAGV